LSGVDIQQKRIFAACGAQQVVVTEYPSPLSKTTVQLIASPILLCSAAYINILILVTATDTRCKSSPASPLCKKVSIGSCCAQANSCKGSNNAKHPKQYSSSTHEMQVTPIQLQATKQVFTLFIYTICATRQYVCVSESTPELQRHI
jgi:hypothetical protein